MAAKEFMYVKKSEVGTMGTDTIEIGHFVVDGKEMSDKVYRVNHFSRKDGTDGNKANAICSIAEANDLAKILMEVK